MEMKPIKSDVGMIWEFVRLSSVSEIIAGQSPESKYYNDKGDGIPFFQGKADFGIDYPSVRYWCTHPTKIAKPKDILISVRAPVGPTNICDIDACVGRGLAAIRTSDKIYYKYLYYYFKTIEEKLASQGNGSTFSAITTSVLKELQIPLPPLATQKRIAEILDAADALRRKDQELLKKYDELAQAIFIDMFGDPVKNEKGWEVRKMGEIVQSEDHLRVPIESSIRQNRKGAFPYYGASGIIDYVDNFIFDGPRLLIGEDGANLVTRSSPIAFIAKGQYWVNNHAHVLNSSNFALLNYLTFWFNSISLLPYVTGSAQPKLNGSKLTNIKVPIPKQKDLEKFEKVISNLVNLENKEFVSNNLFNSLIQKAFKGELVG